MSDITLSAGVRTNLLSLQNTAKMMETTQNRLATGKKVNSALDNPTNFFTSSSLQARSKDLSSLLDSMSNGIKTIEAADNGLTAMTKTLESMQATLRQARQDATFQVESFTVGSDVGSVTFNSGGQFGEGADLEVGPQVATGDGDAFDVSANDATLHIQADSLNGGVALEVEIDEGTTLDQAIAKINSDLSDTDGGAGFEARANDDGEITIVSRFGEDVAVHQSGDGELGFSDDSSAPTTSSNVGSATVDELVTAINNNSETAGKVRASNDNGELRIENLATSSLSVTVGDTTNSIGGNDVRAGLSDQFNELRDQLDKLADDASFNGINLLRGDQLTLTFNETGTSTIDIQTQDGGAVNSASLNLLNIDASQLDGNDSIDSLLDKVGQALNSVRAQSSNFGSNLSIVENRTEFTERMMNTLQTGADKLVLADTNEEGANMLALQTRQQLSSVALSMASQADQSVLRLF